MPAMAQGWTADRVLQLSPDPASSKAGQGLAHAKKWVSLGCDERAVWGECQGSGAKPYQVQFDLGEGISKCSCPSRKFPCKHALGLMLIFTSSGVAKQSAPAWVEEWLTGRAERAKKKQEKAAAPPQPVDEAAQAKRREQRLARITQGLAALKTWSEDLVRGGIAALPTKGYEFFDEPARRMIDAQAPGVARRLRLLGETAAAAGPHWQRPFVTQLASVYLLIRAFEQFPFLPEATQQDVLAALGVPNKAEDALGQSPVHDRWQVVAQEVEQEEMLRVQRTWLFGCQTRRSALLLAFAHGGAPLETTFFPGTEFDGDVCFFPGTGPRAAVKAHDPARPLERLDGLETLDRLCDTAGGAFAAHPWLDEVALPLLRLVPARSEGGWVLVDAEQRCLPAALTEQAGWLALAMSGGQAIDVVASYDGRRLRPLAVMAQEQYVSLAGTNQATGVGAGA